MKNQVGILIFLFALILIVAFMGAFMAMKPVAEAQAELMLRYPDPFEQLIQYRQAEQGSTAVNWIVIVLVLVLAGIAFYAILERWTKAARATKQLIKPARRAARVPTLQPVQPVQLAAPDQPAQLTTGGAGSQQWENSPMQPSPE